METHNFKDLLKFDELDKIKYPSMIKIIGVGKFGSAVVESLDRAELHDIDFITINQGQNALPLEMSAQQDNVRSIAKYHLDINDSAIEKRLHEIMGECKTLAFVVSSLEEDFSPIVSALCRYVITDENDDDNQVALALLKAPNEEFLNDKIQKDIDSIAKVATKVMTFGGTKEEHKTVRSPYDNAAQNIVDVIRTVCKTFIDYDFSCVDYNDVATVLQSGKKAVYGKGVGVGDNRENEAALKLIQHIETNGCKMADVKNMLLLLSVSRCHEPTLENLNTVIDSIHQSVGKYIDILWNASNDIPDDSDALVLNAIAVL